MWTYYDPVMAVPVDWDLAGWTVLDADDYVVRFHMDTGTVIKQKSRSL